jgi:CRP-like cAMP-binding protein
LDNYNDLLKNSTLLKPLTSGFINRLLQDGSVKISEFRKDTVVHFEGDLCSKLDVILKGRITLERIDATGHILTVGRFENNDIIGGNLLFSRKPVYPMTVITSDNTVLLEIDKDALFSIMSTNTAFLLTYLEFVSDNALVLGEKIKYETKKPIRGCIINFLKAECVNQKSTHIMMNITKKALAERIGIQRTSLSREFARMKKDGMIVFDAKSITILDSTIHIEQF